MKRSREAGLTLLEMLIAVSLLSLLSLGILMAMRIGLNAMGKANSRLMDNRRVANTEKVLEQEIAGFMPVIASVATRPGAAGTKTPFFEGEPQSMRFVSSYSLQDGSRGIPQILEFQVSPREHNEGVRLTVNEIPYTGPVAAGSLCVGLVLEPGLGSLVPHFRPIEIGPRSFVLADRLAYCHFAYLESRAKPLIQIWRERWIVPQWPIAIQIAMAPLEHDPSRLQMAGVTAPVHVNRPPILTGGDYF